MKVEPTSARENDRFNPLMEHDVRCEYSRSEGEKHFDEYGAYLPTPKQIREACAQIQEEWKPSERRRRYVGDIRDLAWELPVCRLQNAG